MEKQPAEEESEPLICVRDGTAVGAEEPRCLHPSSFCQFRELCQVVEEERKRRRAADRTETADER